MGLASAGRTSASTGTCGSSGVGLTCCAMRVRGAAGRRGAAGAWAAGAGGAASMRVCSGDTRVAALLGSCRSKAPDSPSSKHTCTATTRATSPASVRRWGWPLTDRAWARAWASGSGMVRSAFNWGANPGRQTVGMKRSAGPGRSGLANRSPRWPMTPRPPRPRPSGHRRQTQAHKNPRSPAAAH